MDQCRAKQFAKGVESKEAVKVKLSIDCAVWTDEPGLSDHCRIGIDRACLCFATLNPLSRHAFLDKTIPCNHRFSSLVRYRDSRRFLVHKLLTLMFVCSCFTHVVVERPMVSTYDWRARYSRSGREKKGGMYGSHHRKCV